MVRPPRLPLVGLLSVPEDITFPEFKPGSFVDSHVHLEEVLQAFQSSLTSSVVLPSSRRTRAGLEMTFDCGRFPRLFAPQCATPTTEGTGAFA